MLRHWKIPLTGTLLLLVGFAVAPRAAEPDQPAAPKKITTVEGITEYQLDNGFRVLLFPDNAKPRFTVNLTVFVGSRHEGYGETGMAHLLEHMLFKGSPKFPKVDKILREKATSYNGTTNFDRTNYFETLPAGDENLKLAMEFEADRLVNCFVKREDLTSEMTVVRNEFESGENSPSRVLGQRIWASAFEWHNYGKSTIGNRSDIERVPIENLQAFYKRWYQPDNAMLVIAGRFDEKKALEYVQQNFGAIPKPKRKLDNTYTEEPAQDGERHVTLRRTGDLPLVGMGYHIPAGRHPDLPALSVLSSILSSPPTGRLYKELVETKKATSVSSSAAPCHDPGLFEVDVDVTKGGSLDDIRDRVTAVIEQVADKGVTDEELQRAKKAFENGFERQLANTEQLAVGLSNWAAQGDWRLFFLHRDRIEKVTAADIQKAAQKYLQKNNRTVGYFIPTEKPERIAIPESPDAKTLVQNYKGRDPVAQGEDFNPTPDNVEKRLAYTDLPEGVKAAFLPKKNKGELVQLRLTLNYGDKETLKGYETAASILPSLMTRGTKKLNYQQFRDELSNLGATLTSTGGRGSINFMVQCKKDKLPAVLELLRGVLREPALDEKEFETIKRQMIAGVEQAKTDPRTLAGIKLSRELNPYPKDDIRYVPTIEESIERAKAVTLDQVEKLYKNFLGSKHGQLVIVGEFDKDKCMTVLNAAFKDWKAPNAFTRIESTVPTNVKPAKHVINTPDKANATLQGGFAFPMNTDHADYPALMTANFILGSGAGSRLWDRVREKEGLSYGVGSSLNASPKDEYASFSLTAICNPENVGKVDKAIAEEIARFHKDGVTKEELENAVKSILDRMHSSRSNDAQLGGLIGSNLFHSRKMDYQAELEKKLKALTPEQVNAAFKKHIDPAKLVIVHAGDFEKK